MSMTLMTTTKDFEISGCDVPLDPALIRDEIVTCGTNTLHLASSLGQHSIFPAS